MRRLEPQSDRSTQARPEPKSPEPVRLEVNHEKALDKITALKTKLDAMGARVAAYDAELAAARLRAEEQARLLAKLSAGRDEQFRERKYLHHQLRWHWARYPGTEQAWDARPRGDDPFARRAAWLKAKLVDAIAEQAGDPADLRVTAVVTICGRHDLLVRTLESFFATNTHPLAAMVVVEDGETGLAAPQRRRFSQHPVDWISTGGRVGQIRAIDEAYRRVRTPYIFHIEDDYDFVRPGYIERSMSILQAEPLCLQVWIRGGRTEHEILREQHVSLGVPWRKVGTYRAVWRGFSFNPGLRRLRDYRLIGSYAANSEARLGKAGLAEAQLSELYGSIGFFAAVLWTGGGEVYAKHTGRGRHVD
jgi:hypothetical protein